MTRIELGARDGRTTGWGALLLLMGAAIALQAQPAAGGNAGARRELARDVRLVPRARIRVLLRATDSARDAEPRVGTIAGVRGDTLDVQFVETTPPERVPLASIARLEVSPGEPHLLRVVGGTAGFVGGAVLGLDFGKLSKPANGCPEQLLCTDDLVTMLVWTTTSVIRAALGRYVGAELIGREHWADVPLPRTVSVRDANGSGVLLVWSWPAGRPGGS